MFGRLRIKKERARHEQQQSDIVSQLHTAISRRSLAEITEFVNKHGDNPALMNAPRISSPDETNCKGETPLMTAILTKQINLIEALLDASALEVNATDNTGKTSLMYAVIYAPTTIATLLRLDDIDINAQDQQQKTALHYACLRRNPLDEILPRYVMQLLGCHEIKLDLTDEDGLTPIDLAQKRGDVVMRRALQQALLQTSHLSTTVPRVGGAGSSDQ